MPNLLSDDLTLVVGDVHISNNQNLRRAKWLGNAIREWQPDRVVFIGDMMTFDCLSNWDKDKRKLMEGRRYQHEIRAGNKFLDEMEGAMGKVRPEFIMTEGNHEERLWRYFEKEPTFEGAVDYRTDLRLNERGWKVVPYKEYYTHRGVDFTHIPINEAGRPVSGKFVCNKAVDIAVRTTVFGHTHKLGSVGQHRHGQAHLQQAINVGCYFEHIDDYALGSVTSYWRGVVLIDHYKNGAVNFWPVRMSKMKAMYERSK